MEAGNPAVTVLGPAEGTLSRGPSSCRRIGPALAARRAGLARRVAAVAALAAVGGGLGLYLVQRQPATHALDRMSEPLSRYALTPAGWMFNLSVASLALAVAAVAAALLLARVVPLASSPLLALAGCGLGLVVLVVFPDETTAGGGLTAVGWVHWCGAAAAFAGAPLAGLALSSRRRAAGRSALLSGARWLSAGCGCCVAGFLAGTVLTLTTRLPVNRVGGAAERALTATEIVTFVVLAVHAHRAAALPHRLAGTARHHRRERGVGPVAKLKSCCGFTRTPFSSPPSPRTPHRRAAHGEGLARIGRRATEVDLEVITGGAGAVRAALASLDSARRTVIRLGNPGVGERAPGGGIVSALDGLPRFHKPRAPQTANLLAAEGHGRGCTVVLVLDEAQLPGTAQLGNLQLLTNAEMDSRSPFACLLVDRPALRERIRLGDFDAGGRRVALTHQVSRSLHRTVNNLAVHAIADAAGHAPTALIVAMPLLLVAPDH